MAFRRRRRVGGRRRRRSSSARRRRVIVLNNPRRRRLYRRRASRLYRNQPRRRRRGGFGGGAGAFLPRDLMTPVMAGVGTGVLQAWVTPWIRQMLPFQFGQGIMGRAVDAGVALLGIWGLRQFRLVNPSTAGAMTTVAIAVPTIGVVMDLMRGMPLMPGGAVAVPQEQIALQGMDYYESPGSYVPYGAQTPGMGYYDAVA